MIGRTLAITRASLIEALRARLTPVAALVLLATVPLVALLFGEDADTRAWLSRAITSEGLRIVLPLAGIIGGGFLLKPAVKRGWSVLPARRAEYFAGAALAGAIVLAVAAGLFAAGGVIANLWLGRHLTVTLAPESLMKQRTIDGQRQFAAGSETGATWANPRDNEEFVVEVPQEVGKDAAGTVEFQMVWTADAPPRDRTPVAVWRERGAEREPLTTEVESRYRVRFAGVQGGDRLVIQPTDPVLIVGTSPDRVRFETVRVNPIPSILALLALSLGATLLCLMLVLLVRSLATAPTAVLAGLLLLAALTLLPSLEPTGRMARDRRAAVTGEESMARRLESQATELPPLFPPKQFDEYLAARVVPGEAWADAGLRLLAGLLLLPAGAWLFRLRQIAK